MASKCAYVKSIDSSPYLSSNLMNMGASLKYYNFQSHSLSVNFLFSLFTLTSCLPMVISASSSNSLSFNFTRFNLANYTDILLDKEASVAGGAIQLTPPNQLSKEARATFGRATYTKPLHLWDQASGNLTDFTTHFSFTINSIGNEISGDGLAFFLAPNGSRLYPDVTYGGGLGLVRNFSTALNSSENHFVAVEFDTFQNEWDPRGSHVGIDVKSTKSVANVPWNVNIKQGNKTDVWIAHDSSQKVLRITFAYVDVNNMNRIGYLSTKIDLASVLPEFETVGFSGSTGYAYETNTICSWEFS